MTLQHAPTRYLVHGVFGDDLQAPQCDAYMHEHDGDRPKGNDSQDTHKRIYPDSSTSDIELQTEQSYNQEEKSEEVGRKTKYIQ